MSEIASNLQENINIEIKSLRLKDLVEQINVQSGIQELTQILQEGKSCSLSGNEGSLSSFIVSHLRSTLNKTILILCNDETYDMYEFDLLRLGEKNSVFNYVYEPSLTLANLLTKESGVVISTPIELQKRVLNPSEAKSKILEIKSGEEIAYDDFIDFLKQNGFEHKDFVEQEGDYAQRGSIVDVYGFGLLHPVRVEFFGDNIDSIRYFDLNSQLSLEQHASVRIIGNLEYEQEGREHNGGKSSSLFDYLPKDCLVVLDDFEGLHFEDETEHYAHEEEVKEKLLKFQQLRLSEKSATDIQIQAKPIQKFQSNFNQFADFIQSVTEEKKEVVFCSRSKKELSELVEFVQNAPSNESRRKEHFSSFITIESVYENLYEGFEFGGMVLLTETDVFGKLHSHKMHRRRKSRKISLRELRALKVGDYIVHEDYGIGVFQGMEKTKVGGSQQECVLIHYEKGDRLFVNVQNIHLLSKYSSAEGKPPTLSKLGSGKWEQNKEKAKKRLKDLARNLISIYAKRKMTKGFAFKPDTVWHREFESAFIFDETPDQLSAIEAIKEDMQSEAPMDRLICGDAGFGKTEVAMRAAFKAVEAGKQVALLVPTTILAHQHFNTFNTRYQNFPIRIEVLSRFVPRKEQKEILKDIYDGKVDITIGTHRIVSKDVKFKDLGLFIIDEEQHFGVGAKEKLREDFPNVDTIVMTATPIPRTLQFSMMGARDLSIISSPPKNRQPVETIIHEYDEEVIKQAISRELGRHGQVFFLHNRVKTIADMYDVIKRLFPKARVGMAHGQMPTKELETAMMDFMQKELDILVSTAIIGSGLDISNANTMIINRAEMFGLADLYQLRGRVGRSERKAFAYFLTPPLSQLKQDAMQRLAVIEAYTELGSGFSVAMRDLDIRGAGNLLGAEQSGFIFDLGFDMYQKILEEAVSELKSTEFQNIFKKAESDKLLPQKPCEVAFFFDAHIPSHYIESASERFSIYNRISNAKSFEELTKLKTELVDRFGKLPEECEHLLATSEIRLKASELWLQRLEISEMKCTLILPDAEQKQFYESPLFDAILKGVQAESLSQFSPQFNNTKKLKVVFSFKDSLKKAPHKAIQQTKTILDAIQALVENREKSPEKV